MLITLLMMALADPTFKIAQQQHSRVKVAYEEKESVVKGMFESKGLSFSGFNMFLRAFKKEQTLEVWIQEKGKAKFVLLHTYKFCATSGVLGPKRKEGDLQIPEGIYYVKHFNPQSNFYLSLGINYPNASDKRLGDASKPGSSIYIHGNCVTVGCIPITDANIKELYVLAVEARNNGQQKIPVHIFPDRLDNGCVEKLIGELSPPVAVQVFWKNLETVYRDFNLTHQLKAVGVNARSEYYFL
jgi:murein L,D-transpeptidase YafK